MSLLWFLNYILIYLHRKYIGTKIICHIQISVPWSWDATSLCNWRPNKVMWHQIRKESAHNRKWGLQYCKEYSCKMEQNKLPKCIFRRLANKQNIRIINKVVVKQFRNCREVNLFEGRCYFGLFGQQALDHRAATVLCVKFFSNMIRRLFTWLAQVHKCH
jgi:hypothetical protein